jgi:hypothetical protein
MKEYDEGFDAYMSSFDYYYGYYDAAHQTEYHKPNETPIAAGD